MQSTQLHQDSNSSKFRSSTASMSAASTSSTWHLPSQASMPKMASTKQLKAMMQKMKGKKFPIPSMAICTALCHALLQCSDSSTKKLLGISSKQMHARSRCHHIFQIYPRYLSVCKGQYLNDIFSKYGTGSELQPNLILCRLVPEVVVHKVLDITLLQLAIKSEQNVEVNRFDGWEVYSITSPDFCLW